MLEIQIETEREGKKGDRVELVSEGVRENRKVSRFCEEALLVLVEKVDEVREKQVDRVQGRRRSFLPIPRR